LAFEIPKATYSGKINPVSIGKNNPITLGGEDSYPFYLFEGKLPHPPRIAMEIWDMRPDDWPDSALAPYQDVLDDPAAWASKCVKDFGAEAIVIQLKSTDPNGLDLGPEEATQTVQKVLKAVDVPVIIWGSGNEKKDAEVLRKISEDCQGANLTLGPVAEGNHKQIGASAMAYKHTVISSTPIDVNLAKQLNILLENLGVPKERIIVDPTTGGLGYGLEYSYSVMERIRMAALAQEDDKLQYALINNVGNEVWKSKEAKLTTEEAPTLGEAAKRGVLMEAVAAVSYLLAGSDLLILRHPETAKLVRKFIDLLITGDTVLAPADLAAKYKALNVKPEGNYPEIVKTAAAVKEEKKGAAPPKEKAVAPKEAPAPKPAVAPKPAAAAKPEAPAAAPKEAPPVDAAAAAKAKADAEAKVKAEAEAQAKAAAAAKAQEAAAAQAKADAAVKAREEAERKAKEEVQAQAQAAEDALAAARAAERAKRDARKEAPGAEGPKRMKVAETQLSPVEKLLAQINRANKRN